MTKPHTTSLKSSTKLELDFLTYWTRAVFTTNYNKIHPKIGLYRKEHRQIIRIIESLPSLIATGQLPKENIISWFMTKKKDFIYYKTRLVSYWVHTGQPTKEDVRKFLGYFGDNVLDEESKALANEPFVKMSKGQSLEKAFGVNNYKHNPNCPEQYPSHIYERVRKITDYILDGGYTLEAACTKWINDDEIEGKEIDRRDLYRWFEELKWYALNDYIYDRATYDIPDNYADGYNPNKLEMHDCITNGIWNYWFSEEDKETSKFCCAEDLPPILFQDMKWVKNNVKLPNMVINKSKEREDRIPLL